MMIINHFKNGGFVVHKACDGKTSAWFDASGKLLDAEFRDSRGRYRAHIGAERKRQLEMIGRLYRKPTCVYLKSKVDA